ncbi:hypothetical protein VNO77_22979 [Canavalia gladiata]|uniref:Uncharacterized protein n=1 Tax=Canavalia gladiata TaxID=3824 RepID=A0AAN9L8V5_CANGL
MPLKHVVCHSLGIDGHHVCCSVSTRLLLSELEHETEQTPQREEHYSLLRKEKQPHCGERPVTKPSAKMQPQYGGDPMSRPRQSEIRRLRDMRCKREMAQVVRIMARDPIASVSKPMQGIFYSH